MAEAGFGVEVMVLHLKNKVIRKILVEGSHCTREIFDASQLIDTAILPREIPDAESAGRLEIADQRRFLLTRRTGDDGDAVERRIEATKAIRVSEPGIQSPIVEDDQIEPFHRAVA